MMENAISFKYLKLAPLGGRGGAQRFFMLVHDIPCKEELFSMSTEWGAEKERMIKSGENPCGSAPVTYLKNVVGEDLHLSQHVAVCRYLARINKIDSGDAWKDYVQDAVADEYQSFCDMWVRTAFSASGDEKEVYKKEKLPEKLELFEALYKKYKVSKESPYLSTNSSGKPLWGDTVLFCLLRDNILTDFMTPADLEPYANLNALFKAYGSIPQVAAWISRAAK